MKKRVFLLVFVIFVGFIYVFFNFSNFYLGSNSRFFLTPFDYPNSYWYCEEQNISAKVCNDEYIYMILTLSNYNKKYILISLDDFNYELYEGGFVKEIIHSSPICKPKVKFKKTFGKVNKFEIQNITICSKFFKNLNFKRVG